MNRSNTLRSLLKVLSQDVALLLLYSQVRWIKRLAVLYQLVINWLVLRLIYAIIQCIFLIAVQSLIVTTTCSSKTCFHLSLLILILFSTTRLDKWTTLHVALVMILRVHHGVPLLKSGENIGLLVHAVLSSPWNSCKLIH